MLLFHLFFLLLNEYPPLPLPPQCPSSGNPSTLQIQHQIQTQSATLWQNSIYRKVGMLCKSIYHLFMLCKFKYKKQHSYLIENRTNATYDTGLLFSCIHYILGQSGFSLMTLHDGCISQFLSTEDTQFP